MPLLIICVFSLFWTLAFSYTGFFWDSISQVYEPANWLYENGLFAWKLPDNIDLGVPPIFAFLHAVAWTCFGKSTMVSHLLLFPFIFGLSWQIYQLVFYVLQEKGIAQKYKAKTYSWYVFFLLFADASLCAQLTFINYEITQYFLFFGAVNTILRRQRKTLTVYLFFLSILSFRSLLLFVSLFVFDFFYHFFFDKTYKKHTSFIFYLPYIFGSLPAVFFYFWYYQTKNSIFGTDQGSWLALQNLTTIEGFFRNVLVLGNRLLDYGRIFVFLYFVGLCISLRKQKIFQNPTVQYLGLLCICSILVVGGLSLCLINPMGHRYFIASYILFSLLTAYLTICYTKHPKIILVSLSIFLFSGNLWIYPEKIAQGWDSTMAYLPYYTLKKEMIFQMDKRDIPIEETASFFPNFYAIEVDNLSNDLRAFSEFKPWQDLPNIQSIQKIEDIQEIRDLQPKTIKNDSSAPASYVLNCSVFNLSDQAIECLQKHYTPIIKLRHLRIEMILYERKTTKNPSKTISPPKEARE
ncbi:MAG: hypothetical protein RRX93_00055 [Bacteroidales bacterium]